MIGAVVKLELTEQDAYTFREFRQHQDTFELLLASGVFNTRGGSVVLHFNAQGQVAKIDRNQVLFHLQANK